MSYLLHLKRAKHCPSCRWIVKRDSQEKIIEVKLVYQPEEYRPASLLDHKSLILTLEDEKAKK